MAEVSAKAPLTWSAPPVTVALPPAPPPCDSQVPLDQPEGRAGPPENSSPTVGRRVTSPSPVSET